MKKYTMLCGACALVSVNVYGFAIAFIYQPSPIAVLVISAFAASLIIYIELNKKRVLV